MRNHAWLEEGAIGDPLGGVYGHGRVYQDPVSALVGAGTSIIGSIIGGNAAEDAAQTQADAANKASQTELEMFNQNRKDMEPWRNAGIGALSQLTAGTAPGGEFQKTFSLSDFTADPGYQFRVNEGMRGLEGSAAARGNLLSGGMLKALTRYGQDAASQEYGNAYNRFNNDLTTRFNRLSSLAGTGQTATRDVGQMGQQVASNIGQNTIGAGNARASGYIGQANALTGGLNNIGQYYSLSKMFPGGSSGTAQPNWTGWGGSAAEPWYG